METKNILNEQEELDKVTEAIRIYRLYCDKFKIEDSYFKRVENGTITKEEISFRNSYNLIKEYQHKLLSEEIISEVVKKCKY